jgi:hypothetical protein
LVRYWVQRLRQVSLVTGFEVRRVGVERSALQVGKDPRRVGLVDLWLQGIISERDRIIGAHNRRNDIAHAADYADGNLVGQAEGIKACRA